MSIAVWLLHKCNCLGCTGMSYTYFPNSACSDIFQIQHVLPVASVAPHISCAAHGQSPVASASSPPLVTTRSLANHGCISPNNISSCRISCAAHPTGLLCCTRRVPSTTQPGIRPFAWGRGVCHKSRSVPRSGHNLGHLLGDAARAQHHTARN